MNCELCQFNNPKCTVSAAIIKDNKLLVVKRNEEPYKDMWDLPGGHVNAEEQLEIAMRRELKEELGVEAEITYMKSFPGSGKWKEKSFAVMAFFYLADIGDQEIQLNEENSEYRWIPLSASDLCEHISYDTNRNFCSWLQNNFRFDLERVHSLVKQLDSTAKVKEYSLYKAILNGYVSTKYQGDILVGIGWIFMRQTMLRKQCIIEDMIVHETQRGKGIGYEILADLVKWARENGAEIVELTTNQKRIAAHKLYEKFGFEIHSTDHMLLKL